MTEGTGGLFQVTSMNNLQPGQNVAIIQLPGNEQTTELKELKEEVENLKNSTSDLRRYNMKSDLVLSGPCLPKEVPGENPITLFCDLVEMFLNVPCHPNSIAQAHRLHKRGKNFLLARFLWLGEYSGKSRIPDFLGSKGAPRRISISKSFHKFCTIAHFHCKFNLIFPFSYFYLR